MSNNRKKYVYGFIAGVLVVLALQWGLGRLDLLRYRLTGEISPESGAAREKLEAICDIIDEEFLFETDETALTEAMYAGLLNGLDDSYSEYYTAEEYESISESHEGHYKGIGVVMIQNKDTGTISVAYCYDGGPAQKAGVQEGDIIYEVNGEAVTDKDLDEVASAIKEGDGDEVTLTLYREKEESYVEVTIVKAEVEIPAVEYEMLEDNIGYISIYQFTGVAASQFEEAYQALSEQGMEGLIVDLRDNPGGLLNSVCDILNSFMPEGILVYTEDKNGDRNEYFSEGETPITIPLTVLINENSASASEIFAGAVKDYGVGTLVGTTTYGKGIVQKTFNLTDGSVVKLTVSSYYTPKGVNIHGTGIEPDITVEQPKDSEEDLQLQKAMENLLE